MLQAKRCLKCGEVSEVEAAPETACPACGAVYAKLEAAATAQPQRSDKAPPPKRQYAKYDAYAIDREFVDQLRVHTLYPTFRRVVNYWYWFGLLFAAGALVTGVLLLFRHGQIAAGLGSLATGLFFIIAARFGKEVWSMLADLSDAAVRIAQKP